MRGGRLFLGEPPKSGPHPGYRGELLVSPVGVYVPVGAEYLPEGFRFGDDWDDEWCEMDVESLIPWHRVWLIEWEEA